MSSDNNWKKLGKYYAFFLFFSLPYQIIIYIAGMSNTVGIREAILRSSLWLIPILLLPKYTKKTAGFIALILWAASIVSWSYFYVFGQDFSQSVLFIIFESNPTESREFIESYISIGLITLLLAYTLLSFILWQKLETVTLPLAQKSVTLGLICLLTAWPFMKPLLIQGASWEYSLKKLEERLEPATPWNIAVGYIKYKRVLHNMQKLLAENSNTPPLKDLKNKKYNDKSTMVLIIGESTNSSRMSLYGYPRKTTPLLDEMRDELLTFNNVISPRPYTIEALEQILSFGDQQNPNEYLTHPTLMNMMKQAGYKSYWITNQQTQTKRNTMLLTFSQQTDHQVYLNNNRVQNAQQLDGSVLKPFEKALNDPAKRKFIVVHLLGTHRAYHYRYPQSYNHFKTRDNVPEWVNNDELEEYNSYDNAILYNDYVVSGLIKRLKKESKNSALVYFSDHGEEVYDTKDLRFTGRNEGKPTPAMYTVPFITWLSPSWSKNMNLEQVNTFTNRVYSNSDFIHSWADLAGIEFKTDDVSRSIYNTAFVRRPRFIGNPNNPKSLMNYDELFPSKQYLASKQQEALTWQDKI